MVVILRLAAQWQDPRSLPGFWTYFKIRQRSYTDGGQVCSHTILNMPDLVRWGSKCLLSYWLIDIGKCILNLQTNEISNIEPLTSSDFCPRNRRSEQSLLFLINLQNSKAKKTEHFMRKVLLPERWGWCAHSHILLLTTLKAENEIYSSGTKWMKGKRRVTCVTGRALSPHRGKHGDHRRNIFLNNGLYLTVFWYSR